MCRHNVPKVLPDEAGGEPASVSSTTTEMEGSVMLFSMAKAEQARGALAGGRYEEAISLYQEAIKLFLSEPDDEQPICEECGHREHYWPHIWTGSIQAIEVFLAGATAQMTTPTSKAFAVATYTSQVL